MKKRKIFFIMERLLIVVLVTFLGILAVRAVDRSEAPEAEGPCPPEMAYVPFGERGICIDIFEASAGESCPYADPENEFQSRSNLDDRSCRSDSSAGRLPWRHISRDQAAAVCAKSGKRLATLEEWQMAALGTPDKDGGWNRQDCQVSRNWGSQPGRSGSAPDCVSSAGVYDMVGNIWEWVSDTVGEGQLDGIDLPGSGYVAAIGSFGMPAKTDDQPNNDYNNDHFWIKKNGSRGVAAGGYWDSGSDAGVYASYAVLSPDSSIPGVGFRCAKPVY